MQDTGTQLNAPWGLDRIDTRELQLDDVYKYGTAYGQGTRVYILDTGMRISHADFGGRAKPGWSAEEEPCETSDDWVCKGVITDATCDDHGTHCGSIAAGETYGVAKGAEIVTVQTLACNGWGTIASSLAGIEWSVNHAKIDGVKSVISFSANENYYEPIYTDVVEAAVDEDVVVVVSAGNHAGDACQASPADVRAAIVVGATDKFDDRTPFSNYGECVDIFAPGQDIPGALATSDTAFGDKSGTSMACPHVSGAAAQLRAVHPTLSAAEISNLLVCHSTPDVVGNIGPVEAPRTPNRMLYAGEPISQFPNVCGPSPPPMPPHSPPSPEAPPSPAPPPCYDGKFRLELSFDDWPSETSWEITTWAGDVVIESDDYSDMKGKHIFHHCLGDYSESACIFKMYDSYGDGMTTPFGKWKIYMNDDLVYKNPAPGEAAEEFSVVETQICAAPPPPPVAKKCSPWCSKFKDSACSWRKCSLCPACMNACPKWCHANTNPKKCGWDSCKPCNFCSDGRPNGAIFCGKGTEWDMKSKMCVSRVPWEEPGPWDIKNK